MMFSGGCTGSSLDSIFFLSLSHTDDFPDGAGQGRVVSMDVSLGVEL